MLCLPGAYLIPVSMDISRKFNATKQEDLISIEKSLQTRVFTILFSQKRKEKKKE